MIMNTKYFSAKNIGISVIAIAVGVVLLFSIFGGREQEPEQLAELQEPIICHPVAGGSQGYNAMHGDRPMIIKITRVVLDPQDVERGETQTVTVYVEDTSNSPITSNTSVKGVIEKGKESIKVSFALKRADGPDLATVWKGSWVNKSADINEDIDGYASCESYVVKITAKTETGEDSTVLSIR